MKPYTVRASDMTYEAIVSEHNTERQAWIACNRARRATAEIWGHKLYGPRHQVHGPDGAGIAMYELDKRWRRR